MRTHRRTFGATAIALGLGLGCSGGGFHGGGGVTPGGQPITQTVGPDGAEIAISETGDPVLAGTTLLIPRGALDRSVVITVSRGDEQAAGAETAVGPSVRFEPDGLTFATPATLTLPWSPSRQPGGDAIAVAITSKGMKSEVTGDALAVDASAKTVALTIAHFTDYEVVAIHGGGMDGGTDGGRLDGGHDGGTDGGHDGGTDGGHDGGIDGGHDGGIFDGGVDQGPHDGGIHD